MQKLRLGMGYTVKIIISSNHQFALNPNFSWFEVEAQNKNFKIDFVD